jgi:glycosyltransferase involved in cell wall biosynthesis
LPAMLESIAAQEYKDYEVIIVDDCSETPPDDIVASYSASEGGGGGMFIRFLKNSSRQYTKETRLNGILAAQGKYIMFIDADDILYGTIALQDNMARLTESKAEILHFRMIIVDEDGAKIRLPGLNRPLAERLKGRSIFEKYVHSGMDCHLIHGKIVARSLWMRCIEPARTINIRRYQEDLLLASLLFLYAESYIASDSFGYQYIFVNKDIQKACGRAFAQYCMLTEFMPYMRKMCHDKALLKFAEAYFFIGLRRNLRKFLLVIDMYEDSKFLDSMLEEIHSHASSDQFMKAMICSKLYDDSKYAIQHLLFSFSNVYFARFRWIKLIYRKCKEWFCGE